MAKYESVEVPFVMIGNRRALSLEQLHEDDYLADFVRRFPKCFEFDPASRFYFFIEPNEL